MKKYNIQTYRKIALVSLYSFMPFMILSIFHIGFLILVAMSFSGFFVMSAIFWRCPSCKRRLPTRHGTLDNASFCPHCGSNLNEPLIINDFKKTNQPIIMIAVIVNLVVAVIIILFSVSEANKMKEEEALFLSIIDQIEETLMLNPEIVERLDLDFSNENLFLTDRLIYNEFSGYHLIIQGNKGSASLSVTVDQEDIIQSIEVQLFDSKEQKDSPDFILTPVNKM